MNLAKACLSIFLAALTGRASDLPDAATIMKRVAANQDQTQKSRTEFVYQEHIRVITRKTNGKLARDEVSDYQVTPTPKGVEKKVQQISGRYWHKDKYLTFSAEPVPDKDTLDGSLVDSFRESLVKDDKSKDGLGEGLFPLTTEEQKDYKYRLMDEETVDGRKTYRIQFGPPNKNDIDWAGEALIDEEEFQPVYVSTRLSRRLPFLVRTMLGTDLPGLGFNVRYKRVADGIWFPVSFGTEFRLHAVFFLNRIITVSLENKDFKRVSVDSQIQYATQ